jgi:hypothetical protein
MLIEQVELSLSSYDLFSKYLKVLKVEKDDEEETGMLLIKGGYEDP